jgi:hypothetical protein
MDVGQCPECGAEVTARTLAKRPRGYWRRRVIRWGVILALLTGIPYGAYRFWRDVNWAPWLPNDVLLWGMTWESDRIDGELLRRCAQHTLSEEELQRIWDYGYEPLLVCPEEVPAGVAVPAKVYLRWRGLFREAIRHRVHGLTDRDTWQIQIGEHSISVSDRPWSWSGDEWGDGVLFDLPALSAGERTITVQGYFWDDEPVVPGLPPGPKRRLDLTMSLRVTDRPMDDYVEDIWEPALADVAKAQVSAQVYVHERQDPSLYIEFAELPFPYAFEVYMRASGQEAYEAVDGAFRLPERWTVDEGVNWGVEFSLGSDVATDEGATIDIQLRPSRALALSRGLDACFGGVIEWLGLQPGERPDFIPVVRPDLTLGLAPESAPSVLLAAPTRVFRWEDGD